jgi:two-component system LytT family sensor kinase
MSDPIPNRGREPFYVEESAVRRGRVQTRPEMRAKVALTLAMWGSTYLLFTLGNLLNGKPGQWTAAGVRAFVMTVGIALCYALHRLLRRLAHRPFRTRALVLAATAPFAAEAYAWLGFFAYAWLHGTSMRMVIADWAVAANVLSQWTWFFIAWTGLYLAIEYNFDAQGRSAAIGRAAQPGAQRQAPRAVQPDQPAFPVQQPQFDLGANPRRARAMRRNGC